MSKQIDYKYFPVEDCMFDIAYDLLNLVSDCLIDTPYGQPEDTFVSDGEPEFECCDFLSVYPHTLRPIQPRRGGFPEENFQAIENCPNFYWAPRFEVTLGRPCRPVMDSKSRLGPKPASNVDKTNHARAIFADAQAMSTCTTEKIWSGYEIAGREWSHASIFPQQVYFDTFGPCTRIRFRIMFDADCTCNPDDLNYDDPDWVDRKVSDGPLGKCYPPLRELLKRG